MNAKTPISILYVHSSADLYGADIALLNIVRGLDRARFRPIVVLPEQGPLADALASHGAETHIMPLMVLHRTLHPGYWAAVVARLLPTAQRLARLIDAERVRLVHTNTGHVFDGAFAARRAGIPHIWHLRETHTSRGRAGSLFRRLIARYSNLVLVVSNAVASAYFSGHPIKTPIQPLYEGVDARRFSPQNDGLGVRDALGVAADAPLIGMAGRIAYWKGHCTFLEAAALVVRQRADARFVVVGDAVTSRDHRHRQELLLLRRERGLEQSVLFPGRRQDMPQVMAALDLFVLPSSLPEPWGFVTLEAMASGKPVIATAQGGPQEMIEDGVTGCLTPPDDPQALAAAILRLLDDRDAAQRMGRAARSVVVARFSCERSCDELTRIYTAILEPEHVCAAR